MIHWTETKTDIPNLEELLERRRTHGGAIIEYARLYSVIVYAQRSSVWEWVPDRAARRKAGFKHAAWCALRGWWSWPGLIATPICIFNNLLGGLDVTRVLTSPPPLPGSPAEDAALRELEAVQQKRLWLFFALLLVIVALVFFVLPRL